MTKYTSVGYTFTNMPGGDAEYSVVTSKSGYETVISHKQEANGDWTIDVVMTYKPTNFDLNFSVEVDQSVPAAYLPNAAIVKVTFWAADRGRWEIITQQEGGEPGVRVDIDPNTRKGYGSYPVWKYESGGSNPYGYRIEVTSFVYPDGTIVPASSVQTDVQWSDDVYTATMTDVTGGKKYNTLDGAYFDQTSNTQKGTLNAVITMDLHNVTFDAQGGKVNGKASQTVNEQYKIPGFKDYVPTREGGYIFDGWYEDANCTIPATEGAVLTKDVTLYAKWIEPMTVSGTVTISGTYQQNGETVPVHEIDKATEAVIVLQELRNGSAVEVASQNVKFKDYSETGSAVYTFSELPNDGKEYQIHVLLPNYNTGYDNESDADKVFTANEYKAVLGTDNVAEVDVHLEFAPPSYTQRLSVDATQIASGYRPAKVLAEVLYRDTGDNHPFQKISQHDVAPYGVQIALTNGTGSGSQSVWNWHTDGTLYDYQMNITKVGDATYDSDSAPYYISYSAANNATTPEVVLEAVLIPKQYPVTFNLNAGTDTVTGMESYQMQDTDADSVTASYTYKTTHTWSFETAITAVPVREGYTFKGWTSNVEGAYVNGKIGAAVQQEVVLTAQWDVNNYTVETEADPEIGGTTTGDGEYEYGATVTVTATAQDGYNFCGWYNGDTAVSLDPEYTFTVTSDVKLTAKFAINTFAVKTEHTTGGTTSGDGEYEYGATATVTATAEPGYKFSGWFEGVEKVSDDASYSFTVTSNRTLKAQFATAYTITTIADPNNGGTVTGGGQYDPNAKVEISAAAKKGYYFVGWYDENNELFTAEPKFTLTVIENRTFTARFEAQKSYKCDYVYLFGYQNTEIGAEGPLLRGELAQMIYRLVKQNEGEQKKGKVFADTAGKWFESGVSYMGAVGAIDQNKTNAQPFVAVSRGETYKMICLGLKFTSDATLDYSDYAKILKNSGYISGDGAVTAKIKRYEFCALFNAILGRSGYSLIDTEGNEVTAETYGYTDLDSGASYYKTMLIATSTFTNGRVDLKKRIERNTYDYSN